MKNIIKYSITTVVVSVFILTGSVFSQEKSDSSKACNSSAKGKSCCVTKNADKDLSKEHSMQKNHKMKTDKKTHEHKMSTKTKSGIVNKGIIDLYSIDKNKDGKVFQDQMDWNVIADKAGKCPLCGMKLKEVTLKQAKKDLLKYGFKVK